MMLPLLFLFAALAATPVATATTPGSEQPQVFRSERIVPDHDHAIEWLPRWTTPDRPRVALALSGGGPRGFAHLGVLLAMAEDGIEFDAVAGTSMGSIIGGLLAAGYDPLEIESIFAERPWDDVLTGLDQRRPHLTEREEFLRDAPLTLGIRHSKRLEVGALVSTDRLQRELYRLFLPAQVASNSDFDRLRYPFRVVATDVLTGERVVAKSGDLVTAIRGSSAIPGIFRPVRFEEHLLVDGLLVENLPVETAQQEFALDLVVAIDSAEGVQSTDDIRGALDVLNRSVNIVTQKRNQELRNLADVLIAPETWRFPATSFDSARVAMVPEGRAAYARTRKSLRDALISKQNSPVHEVGGVEVSGTSLVDADDIAARLGIYEHGRVAELSARMELTRILNRGPYRDGSLEIRQSAKGAILHYNFEEFPIVTEIAASQAGWDEVLGEPFSPWKVRRRAWAIQRTLSGRNDRIWESPQVSFDADSGRLTVIIEPMRLGELDVEATGTVNARRTERAVRPLEDRPLVFERLADRLDELVDRGAISHWELSPQRAEDDRIDLTAAVKGDRFVSLAAAADYRSDFGFGAWGRVAATNLTGRGDFVDLTLAQNSDLAISEARYRTEYGPGRYALGFELGARYLAEDVPTVDAGQEVLDNQEERRTGERVWLSVLHRPRFGGLFRVGAYRSYDRFKATLLLPAEAVTRTGIEADWEWSGQNFLRFPDRGLKLRLFGSRSFSGPEQWHSRIDVEYAYKLLKKNVLVAKFAAGASDGITRRPDTFDPGGYRERYGWIPHGARAPQFATAGLRYRRLLTNLNFARFYIEAGADLLTTAVQRSDLNAGNARYGYGLSLTGVTKFLGPVSVGAFRNEDGADGLFLTAGFRSGL